MIIKYHVNLTEWVTITAWDLSVQSEASKMWSGARGGNPEEKRTGKLWEVGEKRVRREISDKARSRVKSKLFIDLVKPRARVWREGYRFKREIIGKTTKDNLRNFPLPSPLYSRDHPLVFDSQDPLVLR